MQGVKGFQKGQSGNPKGRPIKGNSFGEILEKELKKMEFDSGDDKKVDGKIALSKALVMLAFKGKDDNIKLKAIEKIMDRIDGQALQRIIGDVENTVSVKQLKREAMLENVDKEIIDQLDDIYSTIEKESVE